MKSYDIFNRRSAIGALVALLFLAGAILLPELCSNYVEGQAQTAVTHNTWTSGAPMPTAVFNPAVGVLGGSIYVVGGYDGTENIPGVQIYNPATNTWSTGVPLPAPTDSAAAAVVKNVLYVIGGANSPIYGTATNAVWAYNPKTKTWSSVAAMPTARSEAQAVVEGNVIYVMGGYNGNDFINSVESYNPATKTWTEETPLQETKGEFAAGLIGNKLIGYTIVAAAGAPHPGQITGDTEGYSATTNAWTTLKPDPTPRTAVCSASLGTKLYSAGGYLNDAGSAITANESFQLSTNKWTTRLASMPQGTMFGGSASYKGRLYCFGGWATFQGPVLNNVQIYQP